jgi:hypothetical protein
MIVIVNSSQESAHRTGTFLALPVPVQVTPSSSRFRHEMPGIRRLLKGIEQLDMHDIGGGQRPPTSCRRRQLSSSGKVENADFPR